VKREAESEKDDWREGSDGSDRLTKKEMRRNLPASRKEISVDNIEDV
jgi:hypothetical protein